MRLYLIALVVSISIPFASNQVKSLLASPMEERISLEEMMAMLGVWGGADSHVFHKYFHPASQEMIVQMLECEEFYEHKDFRRPYQFRAVKVLGAIGDEKALQFLKKYYLKDSKIIADHNANRKPNEPILINNARNYGMAFGSMVARKVPGAQAFYEEMFTPAFWNKVPLGAYPANNPNDDRYFKAYVAIMMTDAALNAGEKDIPAFLKRMSKLISPDERVQIGAEGGYIFRNYVKLTLQESIAPEETHEPVPEELNDTLTREERAELLKSYEKVPDYLRKFVQEFKEKHVTPVLQTPAEK